MERPSFSADSLGVGKTFLSMRLLRQVEATGFVLDRRRPHP